MMNRNPALWAMIGIPAVAVIASFFTLFLSIEGADAELPKSYPTEGENLERQFDLRETARRNGLTASLELRADGRIIIDMKSPSGAGMPTSLRLDLTHVTRAELDRLLLLDRLDIAGRFVGSTTPIPPGRWIVRLSDPGHWQLDGRTETPGSPVLLGE